MSVERRRDSRALIHAAAREEFGRRGFAGARVERIAARAGVNKQLIFYYFRSKEGLFRAVVDSAVEGILLAARATPGSQAPVDRFRNAARSLFKALQAHRDVVWLAFLDGEGDGPGPSASIRQLTGTIQSLLSEGQGLGYFRDDIDPEMVAAQVLAIAVGHIVLQGPPGNGAEPAHSSWLDPSIELVVRTVTW